MPTNLDIVDLNAEQGAYGVIGSALVLDLTKAVRCAIDAYLSGDFEPLRGVNQDFYYEESFFGPQSTNLS